MVAVLAIVQPVFVGCARNPHHFRPIVTTIRQPEGDFIRSLTSARGQILVWGWTVDPYLGSGRVPATRDLNIAYQFSPSPEVASYYRGRLLRDLSQNPPEMFIDAVGFNSWFMDDQGVWGLDQVPEISRFVHDFYRPIGDAYGERFFLRSDLAGRNPSIQLPKACAPHALRCIASPRRSYPEGVTTPVMDDQPPVNFPEHALIELQFTPFGRQTENATVLNSEAVPRSFRGLRFQNMGGDLYRLLVGVGDHWVFSRPLAFAEGKTAWLSLEFSGLDVRLQANGQPADTLHLPAPMAASPGPFIIGSWINGACPFTGTIQFFQLVDLAKP